jgi:hypothetical protein
MTKLGTWLGERYAYAWDTAEDAARALFDVDASRFETVTMEEITIAVVSERRASDTVPSPRKWGSVPSSWVAATGTMSARRLLDTLRVVEARSVDPRDIPAVVGIFNELTGKPRGKSGSRQRA